MAHNKRTYHKTVEHLDSRLLTFSMHTTDQIRKLSVTKITTPLSFNVLGHPLSGGLYDRALGVSGDKAELCATCNNTMLKCPGHFGHIELPMPVVNPLFHKTLSKILQISCLQCFTLQMLIHTKMIVCAKLRLLQEGFYSDLEGVEQEVMAYVHSMAKPEVAYIQDIIDGYIKNVRNRERFKVDHAPTVSVTKNANAERVDHIDKIIKDIKFHKVCITCSAQIPKITMMKNKLMTTVLVELPNQSLNSSRTHKLETVLIMPDQSKEYLQKLWANEADMLKAIIPCLTTVDSEFPTDIFFFDIIPVLPPIVRPVNRLGDQLLEHPQTQAYKTIIQNCLVLRNIIRVVQDGDSNNLPEDGRRVFESVRGNNAIEKLHAEWQNLQSNVDHLVDREMSKNADSSGCYGLKQVLEKKEGIIRMHMMGKRVNFAARSVITPDPNLNIDEIGIPEAFALKLTYPVPVTPWNVADLRQMVLNGPNVHPGAVQVEYEDGTVVRISDKEVQRESIAKRLLTLPEKNKFFGIKIVHRHLQNGDVLLLNRQPTLHKPSIMAHKARILKGEKTLRLHYANCKSFNADFDGDEMNAHFPQNEVARSEGYMIANVSNQYLVPKDGTPLSGLIQDHMIAGVGLTLRGKFFNREDYMQLVYSALSDIQGDLVLLPPAILKPKKLWSGKQVISTVIINVTPKGKALINLISTAKINAKQWNVEKPRPWACGVEFENPDTMSEAEVVIRNGQLLGGILDKMHYGATSYGLVHCMYELYGGSCSSKILSSFGKLFQSYLQLTGFTLGIEDIIVQMKADAKRSKIIRECRTIGEGIHHSLLGLSEDTPIEIVKAKMEEGYAKNPKFRALVDRKYKTALDVFTNNINKTCLPAGLIKKFPENNLQLMVQSGAKGSTVNTMQISCLLGQIELEGKRPPLMINGKSLPSFPAYDSSPRAGGFIDGRFLTGIQPQEFFFHCMAGREGLIDTAVKTSRSGYLQRCLIKHLEGLIVDYDATVRDSDGSLIQLNYGEDGLDVSNSKFLRKEQLKFLLENKNAIIDPKLLTELKESSHTDTISKISKKIHKWEKKFGNPLKKRRISEFSKFSADNVKANSSKNKTIDPNCGRSKAALSMMKKWIRTDEDTKKSYQEQCAKCPDPVTSKYRTDLEFGVLPEHLENMVTEYVKSQPNIKKEELRDVICSKVMKTLVPPGEPVGLLAAASIGEPSTQMTLNTFHFAGRGEMNVTLGIPRLREILMMASKNIKTPSMEIPFKNDLPDLERQSNDVKLALTTCYLSDVLQDVKIHRKRELDSDHRLLYTFTLNFLPQEYYSSDYSVTPHDVVLKTERQFLTEVFKGIKKLSKQCGTLLHFEDEKKNNEQADQYLDEIDADDVPEEPPKTSNRLDLGELHESSDEEPIDDEADATLARTRTRHEENREYDDPEDEEIDEAAEKDDQAPNEIQRQPEKDDADDDLGIKIPHYNHKKTTQRRRVVIDSYPNVINYEYDVNNNLWSKFTFWLPQKTIKLDLSMIIKNAAKKVVLWETPAIKRAFIFQNPSQETVLKTDGFNVVEMFKYDKSLDLNRLYSNDIYKISQTYGIEAANRVLIKEVKDVFKMYGITVDTRHLSLIADYMTFDGTFQPMSRKGMECSASPLQQMSFESSLTFLKNAILQGKQDELNSPSARLMLGKPCRAGTGAFSVMLDIKQQLGQC